PTHEVSVIPSHSERQYRSVVPLRIWMSCSEPDHPRSRSLPLPVSPVAGGTVRSSCCSCDGLTRPHPDAQRSREALHGTHCTTRRFTKPRAFITTFTRRDGRSFRSGFIWFFGIRTSGSSNCPATPHVGAALGSGGSKPSRRAPRILSGDLSDPGAGHDGVARPTHASSLITQTPFWLASASQLSSPSAQISVGVPREEVVAASKVSHTAAQLPPRPATRSPRTRVAGPNTTAVSPSATENARRLISSCLCSTSSPAHNTRPCRPTPGVERRDSVARRCAGLLLG